MHPLKNFSLEGDMGGEFDYQSLQKIGKSWLIDAILTFKTSRKEGNLG